MRELTKRLEVAARHLRIIEEFFLENDPEYRLIEDKIESIENFNKLCDQVYYGHDGRQMILSDLLQHALAIRGYYFFFQNRQSYLKFLFYAVNQLMLQENIIRKQPERKKLLDHLEECSDELPGFFEGEDIEWYKKYQECKTASKEEVIGARKRLYRVIDSVLPKSMGNATELLAFAYLINSGIGYIIPLIEIQQAQKLTENDIEVIPPDFLIIREKRVFGCEVGVGPGGVGKIQQCNIFMGRTGIPVITLRVNPPGNNASYRCPVCEKWILYCDKIIEEYSKHNIDKVNKRGLDCQKCSKFDECDKVVYYGAIRKGKEAMHYHYSCVKDIEYVRRAIQRKPERLSPLYLVVEGLEGLK